MMREGFTPRGSAWRWVLLVIALGTASQASAGPPAPAAASDTPSAKRIEIKEHKYNPATLTVPVGTAVTWVNRDDDVHTVTSTAQAFTSRGIDTDETFSYTFTKPGTYAYFCSLHPLMKATIVVK